MIVRPWRTRAQNALTWLLSGAQHVVEGPRADRQVDPEAQQPDQERAPADRGQAVEELADRVEEVADPGDGRRGRRGRGHRPEGTRPQASCTTASASERAIRSASGTTMSAM